jgi:peptidoglycan hydrolase CwlO-like protein
MSEVAMWAVGIVLALLLSVIGVLIKFSFNVLSTSFTELKEGVGQLSHDLLLKIDKITESLQSTNQEFIKILSRNDVQSQFIDGHTDEIERLKEKIAEIQINCALNKHKKIVKKPVTKS